MAIGSTRGKRRLGRHIRPILDRSGLKVDDVVKQSRVSRPTITRMLSGEALARWPALAMVLDVIGATPEEKTHALQLWEVADVDPSAIEHARDLPANYKRLRMDELEAVRERTLDSALIPGLLQTAGYAEALARAARRRIIGDSWDAHAAAERSDRQAALTRENPVEYQALIDEGALHRLVGGPEVMADQLDHLVEMAGRPNVTIQVLSHAAGAYGAQVGAMFLLDFDQSDEPRAAYVEALTGMIPVDDEEAEVLSAVWDDAARLALTAEDSVGLIRAVRQRLGVA
ncbi:helix-turn-helix domain-containing protein [Saccharothrix luteola]|uniref:helix-turn-helix domain-containing protein n=1 Tax=Saccharothrix luteola TaxID=2893018 RepID=UPI001E41F3D5|nr:helix-turn-helix transcriptional regulator [Saccharothrix luteola]MCC8248160.1 helix-turn-helix domain-containing protein [Saccharothrix luteola]